MEIGEVYKGQQPDQRTKNSRRPQTQRENPAPGVVLQLVPKQKVCLVVDMVNLYLGNSQPLAAFIPT